MKKIAVMSGLLVVFLLLAGMVPVCSAADDGNWADRVNVESFGNKLDKAIDDATENTFPYDPEVTSFKCIGSMGDGISKYEMQIKAGEGVYDKLYITVLLRDDLNAENYKDPFGVFTGQYLSGRGGYYSADYSDMKGARDGHPVFMDDRREAAVTSSDADANSIMAPWGVALTTADYFVEIAASRLLVSEITGIAPEEIEMTVLGHSLGATMEAEYLCGPYQKTSVGRIDHAILVETIIRYNADSSNDLFRSGQATNCRVYQEKYDKGECAASAMKDFMALAQKVVDGDETAKTEFQTALRYTYVLKVAMGDFPYSLDYCYWTADSGVDVDDLARKMVSGIVVPYSPRALDIHMSGLMGEAKDIGEVSNLKSGLYMGFGGGCGSLGSEWFERQGFTVMSGGNCGHGFMWNKDSAKNWDTIWDWTDQN